MNQRNACRGLKAAGLGSMLAGAVVLIGAFPGDAGAAPDQTPSTPSSSVVADNPTCGDLAPAGATWIELKVEEPVEDGTFSDGTLTVTIDVRETDDGQVFDWTSNIGVDAVFVKGGPGGLLYVYDPPAESTGDTGLHAPVNPNNDKFFDLSHVSFCYDKDQATTTSSSTSSTSSTTSSSTSSSTTSSTSSTTSTTLGGSTSTIGGSTTTVMAVATTTPPGGGLPRTGSNTGPLVALAVGLFAVGVALVAATRRFITN
jgi:hypothetical protein